MLEFFAAGYGMEAVELCRDTEEKDAVPDEVTLCSVLSACCHASLTDLGNLLEPPQSKPSFLCLNNMLCMVY